MEQLTVDHMKKVSEGGAAADLNNMQLLCRPCHDLKDNQRRMTTRDHPPTFGVQVRDAFTKAGIIPKMRDNSKIKGEKREERQRNLG